VRMQCWEKGLAVARMQRELSYRCISDSGRTMGSSTGYSSAEDGGQQAKHQYRDRCQMIRVILSEEYC